MQRRNLLGLVAVMMTAGCASVDEDDEPEVTPTPGPTPTPTPTDSDDDPETVHHEGFGEVKTEVNTDTFDPDTDMDTVTAWVSDTVELLEDGLEAIEERDDTDEDDEENSNDDNEDENGHGVWEDLHERGIELVERDEEEIEPLMGEEPYDGIPAYDIELASIIRGPEEALRWSLWDLMGIVSIILEGDEPHDDLVETFKQELDIVLQRVEDHPDL